MLGEHGSIQLGCVIFFKGSVDESIDLCMGDKKGKLQQQRHFMAPSLQQSRRHDCWALNQLLQRDLSSHDMQGVSKDNGTLKISQEPYAVSTSSKDRLE